MYIAYNSLGSSDSGGGIDDDNVVWSDTEVVLPGGRAEHCHL